MVLFYSTKNFTFPVGNEFSEPSFALEPRSEVVDEGNSIVLECLVNGWPKPNVRWLLGSETISADGDRVCFHI